MTVPVASEYTDFYVAPNIYLVLWVLFVLAVIAGGVVTAAKGRWGWVFIGLLCAGVLWLVSAFLVPTPRSWWARHRGGAAD
ncbi:MAG: hypothetical protein QOD69_1156 [Solirubrobacteraceae bacterium]|jgi:hypothetical protein|nr:hypothetical protein [Solirubrobacteraceae bacterium]